MTLLDNPEFIEDLKGNLSGASIARKWDCAESTARKHRINFRANDGLPMREKVARAKVKTPNADETFDVTERGDITITKRSDCIIPLSEWLDDLRADGYNPDDFNHSHGHSVWEQGSREDGTKTLYANRFSATKKAKKDDAVEKIDWAAASRFVEDFTYIPAKRDFLVDLAVLQPTDEQWGKTDFDGGTPQTEVRVMNSYAAFADFLRDARPRQTLLARTGDGIENFCSTNSQRDTNDLDLPAMLVQSFKMDLASVKMLAPLTGELINAYVPSNHGRWRSGMKADAGNPHADFGIAVARQIQIVNEQTGFAPNMRVQIPDALMESMTVRCETVNIGMVHGHQVNGPDRLSDWWAAQDHGRMPTWDADVLLVGHFHSYRAQQSGDKRWMFVGPASDNGSSWYSNLKGVRSTSGMLSLAIEGKRVAHQEIL